MSCQEAFTAAFLGLKAQGFRQAAIPDGPCAYRTPDGLKCALGHLIPDDKYRPDMESWGVNDLLENQVLTPQGPRNLLYQLQAIHDTTPNPDKLQNRLRAFAAANHLEVPQ